MHISSFCCTFTAATLDDQGKLTISGSGAMADWMWSSETPWTDYLSSIKSLVINDGVTSLGTSAFENCTGLTSVTIPAGITNIRTWAFYTIAKAWFHDKEIPWKQALISGFVLDPDRKKMSKSKGNVITPQHLIDTYGADSVRYWAARARLGVDTAFEEQIMSQGKKLVNKIFNASKFVFNIVAQSSIKEEADYT